MGNKSLKKSLSPLRSKSANEPLRDIFNQHEWKAKGTPKVLVPLANGSEEMEAVMIIDILRRAGMSVTVASIEKFSAD
ncbi:hypothetical protein KP509_09G064700 [Ceratopteris richardii]|uniref:DJ-1/PfpI domain-containing protein n=1 Tax=Ceratopteris richardii TaxID=49495 RepID=A0A8T2U7K9_CERRI|nr:hypothetical protein KP509_09G064700 [Ceratopteris richardii]